MLRFSLKVFIILLPFVSAFALSGTLTLSVLWSVLLLFIFLLDSIKFDKIYTAGKIENVLISIFYFGALLGYIFNGFLKTKPTNHLIAYTVTVFLFFILINQIFLKYMKDSNFMNTILKYISYTILFVSFFTFLEFTLKFFVGIDVNDFIPRPIRSGYEHNVLDIILPRVRGFASESGHHAMMMETLGPISVYYFYLVSNELKLLRFIFILLIIFSFFLAFSAGAFIFLPLSIFLVFLYSVIFRKFKPIIILKSFLILLGLNLGLYLFTNLNPALVLYSIVKEKLDGSGSLEDRSTRLLNFSEVYESSSYFHKFFGYGPSGFRIAGLEDSILSLYPTFLFETGVIGLLGFIMFVLYIIYIIIKINKPIKIYLLVGFLSCLMHYAIVGGYWRPWIWFLAAFSLYVFRNELYNKSLKYYD